MRHLFVTVDSAGALYPQLALARRLASRGHDVRFLCCRSQREAVARVGFEVSTYTGAPDFDAADPERAVLDWAGDPDEVLTRYCETIWFGPAREVALDVLTEVDCAPVDALVIDYFAFGAGIAAERLGLPTAIVWHTAFNEYDALDELGLARVNAARAELGLPVDTSVYGAYRRARRILTLTTPAFAVSASVPSHVVYAGPQFPPGWEPGAASDPPRGDRPTVLVSLGTSYQAQEGLLAHVVAALGRLDVRGLVGTGPAIGYDGTAPPNVSIHTWIEHSEVLADVDLVITHGGLGTVMAAAAFGVPVLCFPIARDQHRNAERAAALGIGRVHEGAADPVSVLASITASLEHLPGRDAVRRLSGCDAIDADSAVREIERLTATSTLG